eukprot:TRINITY_DN756_c0_g1_i1.p1 TRINITY_DN756_c0_g1~~TRINITY_DN756_c0_g1_i1.p1  ORF type:complete len:428 (+),score=99.17 TRINITY_DN756_c0_g1_i1:43-1326(+)
MEYFKSTYAAMHESKVTRVILGIFVSFWAIGLFFPSSVAHFGLVPNSTLSAHKYHIWNVVTCTFLETKIVVGALNFLVIVFVCPLFERAWGSSNYLKFFVSSLLYTNLTIFFSAVLLFGMTGIDSYIFHSVHGFSGMSAAFVVALKHRFSEQPIMNMPQFEALRFKHLPMIACAAVLLTYWLGLFTGKEPPLVFGGLFYGWIYLRFFMTDEDTGITGDMRDDFSFASMFPAVFKIRQIINCISVVLWKALTELGCCKNTDQINLGLPSSNSLPSSSTSTGTFDLSPSIGLSSTLPVTSTLPRHLDEPAFSYVPVDPNAERRRMLAIAAIDKKIAELQKGTPGFDPLSLSTLSSISSTSIRSLPPPSSFSTPSMISSSTLPSFSALLLPSQASSSSVVSGSSLSSKIAVSSSISTVSAPITVSIPSSN